jgi:hypothetical protein
MIIKKLKVKNKILKTIALKINNHFKIKINKLKSNHSKKPLKKIRIIKKLHLSKLNF